MGFVYFCWHFLPNSQRLSGSSMYENAEIAFGVRLLHRKAGLYPYDPRILILTRPHHITPPRYQLSMSAPCAQGKHTTAFVLLSLLAEASLASTVHEMHRIQARVTDGYVSLFHFRTMSRCKTQVCTHLHTERSTILHILCNWNEE